MTNEQLVESLVGYGADMESAAERFLDDYDLYAVCLGKFLESKSFEELEQALSNGNYPLAFDIAHDLKGVSGNLDLTPLYQAICGIVEPLRAKEYENLNQQYGTIMSCLSELKVLLQD